VLLQLAKRRGQGAFEYILLLAGILLIVVVVIMVLRVSVIPAANQTLQAGLQQWQTLVNFCQDESTATLGIDGATATIALCQAAVPEQTVVTISSAPITFDGANATDRAFMNWSQDNTTVVLNITGKTGSPLNTSEPHGVTVIVAGTALISAKAAQSGCTPSEYSSDANTVLLLHFNDGLNPLTADASTIGLWHLDETIGNTSYDSSPYGNNGIITNSSYTPAGRLGAARSFEGQGKYPSDANQCISVPGANSLRTAAGTLTMEAWVYPSAAPQTMAVLVDKQNVYDWHQITLYSDRIIKGIIDVWNVTSNIHVDAISTAPIPLNQWTHLAVTYDKNYLKLYINGVLNNSVAETRNLSVEGFPNVSIGCKAFQTYTFNGSIDEVAIYNRTLSAVEIAQHASAFARDASQYANNGTLINGTSWTSGRYGNAVQFDGVNDYVNCGNGSSLSGMNQLTVEGWVRYYGGGWQKIIGKGNTSGGGGDFSYIVGTVDDVVRYGVKNVSGSYQSFNGRINVSAGVWHHLAMTYDGTQIKGYVDGVLDDNQSLTGRVREEAAPLTVGAFLTRYYEAGELFNGTIDEVRILNRALNASEVYYDRWCH
jgi:hypothetical protein